MKTITRRRTHRSLLCGDAHVLSTVREAVAIACETLDLEVDYRPRQWRDAAVAMAVRECGVHALRGMALVDAFVARDSSAALLLRSTGMLLHPIVFSVLLDAVRAEVQANA